MQETLFPQPNTWEERQRVEKRRQMGRMEKFGTIENLRKAEGRGQKTFLPSTLCFLLPALCLSAFSPNPFYKAKKLMLQIRGIYRSGCFSFI
jgi:hypothetical protein